MGLYSFHGFIIFTFLTAIQCNNLPHSALEKIPVQIGKSVEIRCSKIINVFEYDYIETAECDPSTTYGDEAKYCYHKWSKDGKEIHNKTGKYEITSSVTVDYCDNFEWTTSIVQSIPYFKQNHSRDDYYNSDMKCYASILRIENVDDDDFGIYQCNFSYHKNDSSYGRGSSVANTTLVREGTEITPRVDYFRGYYTSGMASMFLAQCAVSGSKEVYWYIDRTCEMYDCYEPKDLIPFEELRSLDMWKSFNYTVENHSPHMNISESIIFFQGITSADIIGITCSPLKNADTDKIKKIIPISKKEFYYDGFWHGYIDSSDILPVFITFCVVAVLLFVAAGLVSCARARLFNGWGQRSPIVMQTQMAPQPITYVVPVSPS